LRPTTEFGPPARLTTWPRHHGVSSVQTTRCEFGTDARYVRSVSQARRPALDGVRFVLSRRDDTETCAPRRGDWPVHVQRDRTCMRTVRAYSIELPALVLGGAGKASSSPSVVRAAAAGGR